MKKKELEIQLQQVPSPQNPKPNLEQYTTPATIAADILFTAYQYGDIKDKVIIDLGCGTGIFSIGSALLGAKRITGIDIDKDIIVTAREHALKNNRPVEFQVKDVKNIKSKCDTVIMNPPFGAQKSNKNADRLFIEKACEIAVTVYSLHLRKTIPFLEKMISAIDGEITFQKNYMFPIRGIFQFHEKQVKTFEVNLLRIKTKPSTDDF